MKKYTALLLFALFLNGCDDGDLTVDQIDFETVQDITNCDTTSTLIYKLKDKEALLLQMVAGSIKNDPGTYSYDIDSKGNGQYRVVYRAYDGTVATANICGQIPPSTPRVTEEWLGTDGVIEISTSQVEVPNSNNDGGSRITGYNHDIIFKNITFNKPSGIQTNEELIFGTYKTTVTPADLTFKKTTDNTVYSCSTNTIKTAEDYKNLFNYNSSFYLAIENFDIATLIKNEITPVNQPRTSLISATMNKVYYRTAKSGTGLFTNTNICTAPSPTVDQTWAGQEAVPGTSGIIEVTTTFAAQTYTHTIVLKNVILTKGNSSFKLGNSFLLGTINIADPAN